MEVTFEPVISLPDTTTMVSEPSMEEKIATARKTWSMHGEYLMNDTCIISAIEELRAGIEQSWNLMRRLDIVKGCGVCAATKSGGGCCGAGIENWYDPLILLMNLMIGRDIPENRPDEKSCLFLGPKGCRLTTRFHFCINYLCPEINERLSEQDLALLTSQNGREIYLGWRLENIIRKKLGTKFPA